MLFPVTLSLVLVMTAWCSSDELLRQGQRDQCIANVIATMPDSHNCHHISEEIKSQLAMRMSQCLLSRMGKSLPPGCLDGKDSQCDISGDAWHTYTTFFSHIDNLCHFYWQVLHHERTEKLMTGLADSSEQAYDTLQKNIEQTNQVLKMQQTLNHSMGLAIDHQLQMSKLINKSSQKITDLTANLENFLSSIKRDIESSFGSVRTVLVAVEGGVNKLVAIHSVMSGEVASVKGMLYFICLFIGIGVMTPVMGIVVRTWCWMVLGVNLGLEVVLGGVIEWLFGVTLLRWLCLVCMVGIGVIHILQSRPTMETTLHSQLNTPRLKRILRSVYDEKQLSRYNNPSDRYSKAELECSVAEDE